MQSDERSGMGDILQAKLAEIKTLKDEIKVNVHLASMRLRDEWKSLEKRLPDPAAVKVQLKDKAAETLDRVTKELQEFSARLRSGN
jgi:dsDNA-specific endonuclease/ATPase MutS2